MRDCNTKYCVLKNSKDEYLTWLVGLLGPVLMGSKPAEIISLPKFDDKKNNKIDMIKAHFSVCKKLELRFINEHKENVKILFYNKDSIESYVSDHRNKKFLKSLGYPTHLETKDYIDLMVEKIEQGIIPDEIGVILGYPLKDIIGFIGHPSLKLTKVNGWRVYGDPKVSDMRYQEFSRDRDYVASLLQSIEPAEVLHMM